MMRKGQQGMKCSYSLLLPFIVGSILSTIIGIPCFLATKLPLGMYVPDLASSAYAFSASVPHLSHI
jgi:hypothetical protein